jgi:hypothetical protein
MALHDYRALVNDYGVSESEDMKQTKRETKRWETDDVESKERIIKLIGSLGSGEGSKREKNWGNRRKKKTINTEDLVEEQEEGMVSWL